MSKYTTEVRYLCEAFSGFTPEEAIDKTPMDFATAARDHIFDPNIVIGDADYSSWIKTNILVHYYTREICDETFGLWKMRINQRLREKQDYYTSLYNTLTLQDAIGADPYRDTDFSVHRANTDSGQKSGNDEIRKTGSGSAYSTTDSGSTMNKSGADNQTADYDKTVTGEKTANETGYNLHSDTPEGSVSGINAAITGMEGSGFLSDAQKQTSDANSTQYEAQTGKDVTTTAYGHQVDEKTQTANVSGDTRDYSDAKEYVETHASQGDMLESQSGKRGRASLSSLLAEYRDKLLNLDERIIYDMRDMFLMLW